MIDKFKGTSPTGEFVELKQVVSELIDCMSCRGGRIPIAFSLGGELVPIKTVRLIPCVVTDDGEELVEVDYADTGHDVDTYAVALGGAGCPNCDPLSSKSESPAVVISDSLINHCEKANKRDYKIYSALKEYGFSESDSQVVVDIVNEMDKGVEND